MLEDGFVEKPSKLRSGKRFLAISAHLHRPTGLFDMFSSRYVLRDGIAVRDGVITESPYYLLNSLPRMLKMDRRHSGKFPADLIAISKRQKTRSFPENLFVTYPSNQPEY